MQPIHLVLAVALSSMFFEPAFSQTAPAPRATPLEILPAPREYQQPEVAFVVPKERAVTVNLSLDRPPLPRKSQFKLKRSGQVLAELSQDRPEQLEFEVLIEGPVCDVPVHLPVCPTSSINAAYAEHGEAHPELVVAELAKLGLPEVSVIAILRLHGTERHDGDGPLGVDLFDSWTPYYRVAFKESSVPPVLVKVPRVDCDLYRMMQKSVAENLSHDDELVVMTISEENIDSHSRQFPRYREPEDDRLPVIPEPDGGPTESAPAEGVPALPVPGDPFIDDEA